MSVLDGLLSKIFPHRGTVYRRIGGQGMIHRLVDEFYSIMQTDPQARECLATHEGRDIKVSAEKLKDFLSGWLGGPQVYNQKYGHPRLRMRHFPFAIGPTEARQWLYCMEMALSRSGVRPEDQTQMLKAFEGLTELIKNRG